ncbi:MAG: hypothetical protein A2007_03870 [Verrucomicrobia bacterium GWC2_42_7]|nr:MAG: hypothetical protein A2007_03870 [Verrucomicrobia bacterium GWC2_42_7]
MTSHKSGHSFKPFVVLGIFLLVWWGLPPVFHSFTKVTFAEIQAPFATLHSHIKDFQFYLELQLHSKKELIETCRDLSRLNAYHSLQKQENKSTQTEIEALELLLHLPPNPGFRYEVARVCFRDISAWWQQLIIRKGQNYGIMPGQAVVFGGGVVGKIAESYATTAVVELVTSPNFRCSAHFESDNSPVIYQGLINKPFSSPTGYVTNAPNKITAGIHLVSSRLGGIFPDGLIIGFVNQLQPEADGLFQSGTVSLDPRLFEIQEVAVLIPSELE